MTAVSKRPGYEEQYRRAAGQVIGRLRAERGWSYREFAENAGTSHTNLYAAERGEATPGLDVLGRIAAAFGMDLVELLLLIIAEMSGGPRASLLAASARMSGQDLQFLADFADFLVQRRGPG